jgi:hypothetical protein
MDRVSLPADRRGEVASHQIPSRQVEATERLVFEACGSRPGIEAQLPERLALIDVADAGTDALLQQELAQRRYF